MPKTAVVIGCIEGTLPASDRAAATLAVTRLGNDVVVCSPHQDELALRYALGAGAREVVASLAECSADVTLMGRGVPGSKGT